MKINWLKVTGSHYPPKPLEPVPDEDIVRGVIALRLGREAGIHGVEVCGYSRRTAGRIRLGLNRIYNIRKNRDDL